MKCRILMHVDVDARDHAQALDWAKKLGELVKHPMMRLSIEGEGIRLYGGDGRPVIYEPKREAAWYRILMHVDVDARDQQQALDWAKKIEGLMKHPMTRMSIESEGIRLHGGDGRPVVYEPKREAV